MPKHRSRYVEGDRLLDRYTVEKVLGRGAFGEVLQVVDRETEHQYALKYVPPEIARNSAQMQAIRANFRLVSELTHPHIAAIRYLINDPSSDQVFILMDLVRGENLGQWITAYREATNDAQAPLPLPLVLGVAEQLASALDYAHSQPASFNKDGTISRYGILHRDLKPANVMIESVRKYREGVPYAKVVDFGLAAEIQASLLSMTQMQVDLNRVAGSPAYMSPEQWTGRRLTRGIDQWALAVMIYEMVEGRLPFHGVNFADLREQVLGGRVYAPECFTERQWDALRVSLSPDRTQRHRSCLALVKALAEAEQSTRDSICLSEIPMPSESPATALAAFPRESPAVQPAPETVEPLAQLAQATLRPPMAVRESEDTVGEIDAKTDTRRDIAAAALTLQKPRSRPKRAAAVTLGVLASAAIALIVWQSYAGKGNEKGRLDVAQTTDVSDSSGTPLTKQVDKLEIASDKKPATTESPQNIQQASPPESKGNRSSPSAPKSVDSDVPDVRKIDPPPPNSVDAPSRAPPITETPRIVPRATGRIAYSKPDPPSLVGAELRIDGGSTPWSPIYSVAVSADGTKALIGREDNTSRLWDVRTGKELQRFEGHSGNARAVALSADGAKALTGSDDSTARLWDANTGREVQRFDGHSGLVLAVALSADGTRALTGSNDKTARLWDANTGKELQRFEGHSGTVMAVALSADGTKALTGIFDKTARLWDANTGKELQRFEGHSGAIWSVALSADGTKALTGSEDNTARLWNANTSKELQRFKGIWARAVTLSGDGTKTLTACEDKTARLWDSNTGKELQHFEGHSGYVVAVALFADGTKALTGSEDNTARLWDLDTGKELQRFESHSGQVWAVALSANGMKALTGSIDKTPRLWDTTTGKELQRFEGHLSYVVAVALSADGMKALTGSTDNTARVWDANTGKELERFEGHTNYVEAVALSADGMKALTGSRDNTARLWDVNTGKELQRFEGHSDWVQTVALSADGMKALTGSDDNTARVWDANTGKELQQLEGHSGHVQAVALSDDGTKALTGSTDNTVRLWNANTGKELQRFNVRGQDSRFATSIGSGVIVTTGETLQLWDVHTGGMVGRMILLNDGTFVFVAPDGRYDSSRSGSAPHVYWWSNGKRISLDELKDHYVPGLAKELLGARQ
jgi:WD40 repeat protein